MKQYIFTVAFLLGAKLCSQISIPPANTFQCNEWPTVYFMVNQGSGPYTYTIQPPSSCSSSLSYTLSNFTSPCSFTMSCPGTYTIKVEDGNNLPIGTATTAIFFATHINSGILGTSSNDTICLTQANTLFAQYPQTYILNSIIWSNGQTTETVNVSPTVATSYSFSGVIYSAIYSRSCTASGSTTIHVIDCGFYSGIQEQAFEAARFFPNPTLDELYYTGPEEFDKITIKNTLGEIIEVIVSPPMDKDLKLSLRGFPAGVYFVVMENKHGMEISKVVKR